MKLKSMTLTFEDDQGSSGLLNQTRDRGHPAVELPDFKVEVSVYEQVGREGVILFCEDIMGAIGPGKGLDEALMNLLCAIRQIRNGEAPAWLQQELDRSRRRLRSVG